MGATATSELTVVLKADGSGLTGTVRVSAEEIRKLGQVLDSTSDKADKAGRSLDKASDRASSFAKEFGVAAGAVIAGFGVILKKQLDFADATGKVADKLGTTTEFISAMGYAAKTNGGNVEGMNKALFALADNMKKVGEGGKIQRAAFDELGVSVYSARGGLKTVEEILPEIARGLAGIKDPTERAALAQRVLGDGSKDLLLALLELADKGMDGVTEKARKMGQLISGDTAKAAADLNDAIDAVKSTVTGFANQLIANLAPALANYLKETKDGAKGSDDFKVAADGLTTGIKYLAVGFNFVKNTVEDFVLIIGASVDTLGALASAAFAAVRGMTSGAEALLAAKQGNLAAAKKMLDDSKAGFAEIAQAGVTVKSAWQAAADGIKQNDAEFEQFKNRMVGTFSEVRAGATSAAVEAKRTYTELPPLVVNYADSQEALAKAAREAARAQREADRVERERAESIKKLALETVKAEVDSGKLTDAQGKYVRTIIEANAAMQVAIKRGLDRNAVEQQWQAIKKSALATLERETEEERKHADIVGRINKDLEESLRLAGLSNDQRRVEETVLRAAAEAQKLYNEGKRESPTLSKAEEDAIRSNTAALLAESQARDQARQDIEEFQSTVARGFSSVSGAVGDFLTGTIKSWKDFGRTLLDSAKRMVADLIAQFFQLSVIRPLLASLFGGSYSVQASAGQMALSSIFGGGAGGGAAGAGGGAGGGMGSLLSMGSTLFSGGGGGGFTGMLGNIGQSARGLWYGGGGLSGNTASGFVYNNPGAVGPPVAGAGGPWGGTIGGFSTVGLMGGAAGLMYGLGRGQGGIATAASGAAGAVGGYAIGTAAATAMSSGIAAGLSAIPVVGWIAIAALLIDKFSGGKLFGTKFQTKSATQSLSIGADGGDASTILHQERQGALFSGKKKRDKEVAASAEAEKAADDLFKAIGDTMKQAANALQIEVPPVIDAKFQTITEYDKKGHAKSTKYLVEAFGKHWEEASAEAAQKRLGAEAILAVVDKASGGAAMKIAEQWQGNVDQLADGVQLLMGVQASLTHKTEILGTTLEGVADVVQDFAVGGESLVATYSRLTAETKSVQDAFALAGQTLQKTGRDLVEFADDIAQKAGGGEAAQQLWSRFFTSFYSQAELASRQVDQLRPTLNTELSDLGLDPGVTMAEFRTAFEAALPNLSSDDIVKWLKAANDVATFYELSEKAGNAAGGASSAVRNYAAMVADIDQQLAEAGKGGGVSAFQAALAQIGQQEANTIAQMNAAARAAGLQGAREQDLAKVHELAALRASAAARQLLDASSADIVSRLRGSDGLTSAAQSAGSAISSVADGLNSMADAAQRARESALLDAQLSPLNAQQQLEEAKRQLAAGGDESVLRRALEIARGLDASGADYTAHFNELMGLFHPAAQASDAGGASSAYDASANAGTQMSALERAQLAQQLAQNVADKAGFTGDSFADVAAGWGYSLGELSRDLGFTGDQLTAYLQSLQADSYGLSDIKDIYDHNTDRIVNAILHGEDITSAVSQSAITGSKPGGAETITAPQVNVVATGKGEAPASEKAQQDTNAALTALLAKMDKVADLMVANVKTTASGTEELVGALDQVRTSVDDVRREVGSRGSDGNFRTSRALQP